MSETGRRDFSFSMGAVDSLGASNKLPPSPSVAEEEEEGRTKEEGESGREKKEDDKEEEPRQVPLQNIQWNFRFVAWTYLTC